MDRTLFTLLLSIATFSHSADLQAATRLEAKERHLEKEGAKVEMQNKWKIQSQLFLQTVIGPDMLNDTRDPQISFQALERHAGFQEFLKYCEKHTAQAKDCKDALLAKEARSKTGLYKAIALFTRWRYASHMPQMLADLTKLVTVHPRDSAGNFLDQSLNPAVIEAGKYFKAFSEKNGLGFENPVGKSSGKNNQIFLVMLPGENEAEPLSLYMHSDVVPADPNQWGFKNAQGQWVEKIPPFASTFKKEGQIYKDKERAALKKKTADLRKQLALAKDPAQIKRIKEELFVATQELKHISGDRFYGRGVIDDKAAIVSSLYALKSIKEMQKLGFLPKLKRSIHLVIETTEETTSEGVQTYREWAEENGVSLDKQISIGLDANYPATIAEKGIGRINLLFAKENVQSNGDNVVVALLHGSETPDMQAQNTVAGVAKITFRGNVQKFVSALQDTSNGASILARFEAWFKQEWEKAPTKDRYTPANVSVTTNGDSATLSFHGIERVSFMAHDGSNSLIKALAFLKFYETQVADKKVEIAGNHYTKLANYIWTEFHLDYSCRRIGCYYFDPFDAAENKTSNVDTSFMGAITVVPTLLTENDQEAFVVLDIRAPRGAEGSSKEQLDQTAVKLQATLEAKIQSHASAYGFTPVYRFQMAPRYTSPKQPWLSALVDTFKSVTGNHDFGPISISGSTTASMELGGINFGPTMPDEIDVYHVANEFKNKKNFERDLQMFTEMFLRVSQ